MNNRQIAEELIALAKRIDPEASPELWEIKIEKGMTIEGVIAECKKLFPVYRWTDENLDQLINSDRTSKKSYTVKVKANVEADENLKHISAKDLTVKGITLLERLVLELQYFKETGKHLDIENWTLCSGSRHSGGRVPSVGWCDVRLSVSWDYVGLSDGGLRAREVVS